MRAGQLNGFSKNNRREGSNAKADPVASRARGAAGEGARASVRFRSGAGESTDNILRDRALGRPKRNKNRAPIYSFSGTLRSSSADQAIARLAIFWRTALT